MKTIIIILGILLSGCGDTTTTPDTNSFSEGSTISINVTQPECKTCETNIDASNALDKIIMLAEKFLDKMEITGSNDDSITINVSVINDLIADAVADLEDGVDSQEVVTDFDSSLVDLEKAEGVETI